MKYHLRGLNAIDSLCGLKPSPARWIFDYIGWSNHYAKDMACKKCQNIIERLQKPQSN